MLAHALLLTLALPALAAPVPAPPDADANAGAELARRIHFSDVIGHLGDGGFTNSIACALKGCPPPQARPQGGPEWNTEE